MIRIPYCIRYRLFLWAVKYMSRRPADVVIGGDYLFRWWVVKTKWFRLYLHKVHRSDDDRALHDHPWHSAGLILRGSYWEWLWNGRVRELEPGDLVFRKATLAHRLEVERGPVITLFITGPKIREWGFWKHCPCSPVPTKWVPWYEFEKRDGASVQAKGAE